MSHFERLQFANPGSLVQKHKSVESLALPIIRSSDVLSLPPLDCTDFDYSYPSCDIKKQSDILALTLKLFFSSRMVFIKKLAEQLLNDNGHLQPEVRQKHNSSLDASNSSAHQTNSQNPSSLPPENPSTAKLKTAKSKSLMKYEYVGKYMEEILNKNRKKAGVVVQNNNTGGYQIIYPTSAGACGRYSSPLFTEKERKLVEAGQIKPRVIACSSYPGGYYNEYWSNGYTSYGRG